MVLCAGAESQGIVTLGMSILAAFLAGTLRARRL
jgi:hypothetical protein